ncbi:hypothetical protein ACFXKC_52815 [Streptomyces sp. NPDC059340]|uniref:hypothetical protein n=1 Tax=Streptomyces sp. NPDC059340 TaxID=3346806 RepID=UPI0036AE6C2D
MRRCRYRGQTKAHLQHILTAIAVNIECLSRQSSDESAPRVRRQPSRTISTGTASHACLRPTCPASRPPARSRRRQ